MFPGDQHKTPGANYNPFEEPKISPYTATEIATLQAKLDQQLGPEFISSRPGAGGKKVHYIQADKCINLANTVFGFNGWCSSIKGMEVDFLDQNRDGRWSIGVSVTVRVSLKDGTFHEDVGYGTMENGKNKAQVFEKAKKEGTTDGLKRALRYFGNVLGNCLYDQDYLSKISRMKSIKTTFDEKRLHRHNDQLIKGTTTSTTLAVKPQDEYDDVEFEDLASYGGDDIFDDLMPDEVTVQHGASETTSITASTESRTASNPVEQDKRPIRPSNIAVSDHKPQPNSSTPQGRAAMPSADSVSRTGPKGPSVSNPLHTSRIAPSKKPMSDSPLNPAGAQIPQPQEYNIETPSKAPLAGFFTGRATLGPEGENLALSEKSPSFNPHKPITISRSTGIDHTKSSPVTRRQVQSASNGPRPGYLSNIGTNRQVGAPPGRGPYRPPNMANVVGQKRPADQSATMAPKAPPGQQYEGVNSRVDSKRMRA